MNKYDHAKQFQKIAREEWFKDHQIRLVHFESPDSPYYIDVVDFRNPGSSAYAVRYIFDRNRVFVSGDLGDAVFNCTWKPTPYDYHWKDIWYVFEKLSAAEKDGMMAYDEDVCETCIRQMLLEPDSQGRYTKYPEKYARDDAAKHTIRELIKGTKDASSLDQWAHVMSEIDNNDGCVSLSVLDGDYWEWMYSAGAVMPPRVVGIITGLQMISEQLNEADKNE